MDVTGRKRAIYQDQLGVGTSANGFTVSLTSFLVIPLSYIGFTIIVVAIALW